MRIALLLLMYIGLLVPASAQDLLTYSSKNLPRTDSVWVFKPASYSPAKTYPTVYLLHGYSGTYRAWNKLISVQQYADAYGFLVVCPDGLFDSWYLDSPMQPDHQYASFFFKELMPGIEGKYAVDKASVFITGLSMGGHGALTLFLQHPERFRSAGSTSGVVDLRVGYSPNYRITELLGRDMQQENALWLRYSVLGNIDKLAGLKKLIIFDCGTEDKFHPANDALYRRCLELKIPATYTSQPGGHTGTYWRQNVKTHFDFFAAQLAAKPKTASKTLQTRP